MRIARVLVGVPVVSAVVVISALIVTTLGGGLLFIIPGVLALAGPRFILVTQVVPQVHYEDPHAHIQHVATRLLAMDSDVLAGFHSANGPFHWTDQRPHMPRWFRYDTKIKGCRFIQISTTFGVGFCDNYHGPYQPIAELDGDRAQRVAAILAQGTQHL